MPNPHDHIAATASRTEEELDRMHAELASLEGEVLINGRRVAEEIWKSRLIAFLDRHPDAETELRNLFARAAAPAAHVTINATARGNAKQVFQGQGTQTNNFHDEYINGSI